MLIALVAAAVTATLVVTGPTASAAASHGDVAGTVTLTDARGERFDAAGAELVLACADTPDEPPTAASDEHGVFRFADLRPGDCSLTADLQGFGRVTTNLVVRAGEALHLEIHLEVIPVRSGVRVLAKSTGLRTPAGSIDRRTDPRLVRCVRAGVRRKCLTQPAPTGP
jgi:Carboxypeptidase regulatory-like domain